MLSVYRTLSVRYLSRRWFRAVLIVASIALGVATLVATRSLNETMTQAGLAVVNPIAGVADLIVSYGDVPVSRNLVRELARVPGVQAVRPRIFENVKLPDLGNRTVLIMGIDVVEELKAEKKGALDVTLSPGTEERFMAAHIAYPLSGRPPVVVGKELDRELPPASWFLKVPNKDPKLGVFYLVHTGTLEGRGPAAALGGNVLILDLPHAARVLGMEGGKCTRLDIMLQPGANKDKVRHDVEKALKDRAQVRTPDEQNEAVGNVMAGMQTGFSLCGLAALVVGMFLVYNALAVCVAERRHEIGVLLSLGATRGQVWALFAGEAAFLGLAGSILGIPLGLGLAYLGLQPVQDILRDIFFNIEASRIDLSFGLIVTAMTAGMVTAVVAGLVPAIAASRENPAEAVRRIVKAPSWRYRFLQIVTSLTLLAIGTLLILLRHVLPARFGIYGGMMMVLMAALMSTPLFTAVAAQLLQPIARHLLSIEARLAADNLVRSPGRTGLVIAALAAGVALVMQTAGTIRSNRIALHEWVQNSISSDLIVTSGSPVGAGDQSLAMNQSLGEKIAELPDIEAVLPIRRRKIEFRSAHLNTRVLILAFDARPFYEIDKKRGMKSSDVELYRQLADHPGGCLVSQNFAALHRVRDGDSISLKSDKGPVELMVLGRLEDYSWNHGTIFINRPDFLKYWNDSKVDVYDVYIPKGTKPETMKAVQENILRKYGAQNSLVILTRAELQTHIDNMIERLYGIAYSQQIVVMFVAALGVVTALLISVLQRRREMGLLRAIGASRSQVVHSVLAEAGFMGLIGTAIGLLVGVPLQWYVLNVLILEESGYLFPVLVPWLGALFIACAAMVTATLAGLGPAVFAVRQRIPEAIAYE